MHAGASLNRRFTLLRPDAYDLPGAQRWLARDERRSVDVHVLLVTVSAPAAIHQAAVRASQVRDLRFTRILAAGRTVLGDTRVTYVVTEIPQALPVASLVGRRIVPGSVAAAIVGEAAHALQRAAATGVRHGFIRPAAVHILDSGRVVLSGLGVDGRLAVRAGLAQGLSERADAAALVRLYLELVTGIDTGEVTVADLPDTLPARAATMARSAIANNPPRTLAAVVAAVSPVDSRVLRHVSSSLTQWPWAPGAEPPALPPAARLGLDVSLAPQTAAHAARLAAYGQVRVIADAQLSRLVDGGLVGSLVEADAPVDRTSELPDTYVAASTEEAAEFSARIRRVAAREAHQELGLDTWERVVADQDRPPRPSVLQAVLEWLHRRRPGSVVLGTAAEQARHRAHRPGPLRAGPVVVSICVSLIIVAGIISIDILTEPIRSRDDAPVDPPSHYPEFTFSPEPQVSPSAETEPNGHEEADDQDGGAAEGTA